MSQFSLTLAEYAVKSTLILLFAAALTLALRRASAALRHIVWVAAFISVLAVPFVGRLAPRWELGLDLPSEALSPDARIPTTSIEPPPAGNATPQTAPFDAGAERVAPAPHPAADAPRRPSEAWILAIWLVGALTVGLPVTLGFRTIRRLRALSQPEDDRVDRAHLGLRVGLRRAWQLLVSRTSVPPAAMTWGIVRPIVLLPKESDGWPLERLEAVLLHELAHVRRFDCLSQLLSLLTCALYWFNPAVWLCARAMRAEAETAADDSVLRTGVTPSTYAEELLRIAAGLGRRPQPLQSIGISLMNESKIESRIKSILNPTVRRRGSTAIEALVVAFSALCVLLPIAAMQPLGAAQKSSDTALTPASKSLGPKGVKKAIAARRGKVGPYKIIDGRHLVDAKALGLRLKKGDMVISATSSGKKLIRMVPRDGFRVPADATALVVVDPTRSRVHASSRDKRSADPARTKPPLLKSADSLVISPAAGLSRLGVTPLATATPVDVARLVTTSTFEVGTPQVLVPAKSLDIQVALPPVKVLDPATTDRLPVIVGTSALTISPANSAAVLTGSLPRIASPSGQTIPLAGLSGVRMVTFPPDRVLDLLTKSSGTSRLILAPPQQAKKRAVLSLDGLAGVKGNPFIRTREGLNFGGHDPFQPGGEIHPGDALLIGDEGNLEIAEAKFKVANANLTRLKKLFEAGAAAKGDVEVAEARLNVAVAKLALAKKLHELHDKPTSK